MRYKVGDRVKVKSLDWYKENKNGNGVVKTDQKFRIEMSQYCGKIAEIIQVWQTYYKLDIDKGNWFWDDEMIEGLVEQTPCDHINFNAKNLSFADRVELQLGDKWELLNENGRTYAVKKTPKYPTTYEECCEVMKCDLWFEINTCYHGPELCVLYKLLMCRDAYWKIAGDWKPDWKKNIDKYNLIVYEGDVIKDMHSSVNHVLSFPTSEMRDTFYENFKDLINECKELL